jgi:DNA-binding HxlR family transcriptional regulator
VTRTVYPTKPPSVEYALTDLGRTLLEPVMGLVTWVQKSQTTIEQARVKYDKAQSERRTTRPTKLAL